MATSDTKKENHARTYWIETEVSGSAEHHVSAGRAVMLLPWTLLNLAWGSSDETMGDGSVGEAPRGVKLWSRGLELVDYSAPKMECFWGTLEQYSVASSRFEGESRLGLFVHIGVEHVVDIEIDHAADSPPSAVAVAFMSSWKRSAVEASLLSGLIVTKLSLSCRPDAIPRSVWTEHLRSAPRWERRVWATYWLQFYLATLSRLEFYHSVLPSDGERCVRRASACDGLLEPAYAGKAED